MKRLKNILYVTQAPFEDQASFEHAVSLAKNNQARLTAATVMEAPPLSGAYPSEISVEGLKRAMIEERLEGLETLLKPVRGEVEAEAEVLVGVAFIEIIRDVLRAQRDMVLKEAERGDGGIKGRLFGGTDMHLLRKCPCPLWLTRAGEVPPLRRLLAAVDFNAYEPTDSDWALNREILQLAVSLAVSQSAELHIAHVWMAWAEDSLRYGRASVPKASADAYVNAEEAQHRRGLDRLLNELVTWVGKDAVEYLKPQRHLVKGQAREAIPLLTKSLQIDLIVMGTVARTGVPGLIIGNTAERILNEIECSVLALKPPGFRTPVTLQA